MSIEITNRLQDQSEVEVTMTDANLDEHIDWLDESDSIELIFKLMKEFNITTQELDAFVIFCKGS